MAKWTLALVLAAAVLAGCSGDKGPYRAPGQKTCDDGGSGGVIVDGVCL
ncbi:MAG TPA: hypothetical protein VM422_04730 [Amaricoccus sp.]|jgi:hypothetical protein|nr:hypothetical protein [Amaricoccus sp.]